MSTRMKYVIIVVGGRRLPFIFPEAVMHSDLVRQLGYKPEQVYSAGFISMPRTTEHLDMDSGLDLLVTSGRSKSLNCDSKLNDARTIEDALYASHHALERDAAREARQHGVREVPTVSDDDLM